MLATAPDVHLGERAARRLLADCKTLSWLVDPPQSTALSLMREAIDDAHDVANGVAAKILDAQSRMLGTV